MGYDLAVGDCASILFYDDSSVQSITSTYTNLGKTDEIYMGEGNDVAVGGQGMDTIDGYNGTNIVVGDSAEILFYRLPLPAPSENEDGYFWNIPKSIKSISCEFGNEDTISGGNGTDYIIGGALDDTVYALGDADLVLGDHGTIFLYQNTPYKLINVTTADAGCMPGQDTIYLGDGNDIAFGGALGDYIEGKYLKSSLGGCPLKWHLKSLTNNVPFLSSRVKHRQ
jgi:Ca2+-binding RTX toxin-like protein